MKYYHSYQFKNQQKYKIFSEQNKLFLYSHVCSVHSSIKNFESLVLYGDEFTKEIFDRLCFVRSRICFCLCYYCLYFDLKVKGQLGHLNYYLFPDIIKVNCFFRMVFLL